MHAHQLVGIEGEILRVLVAAVIDGLFGRQVVPLFASHLASSTGRAQGGVNKK
jgi:hypothetical protein